MGRSLKGIITKGIGGFYYVDTAEGFSEERVYECRARGLFRKDKLKPLPGDTALIEVSGELTGTVTDIIDRKNYLKRPPVANIDCLVIVSSVASPAANTLITDRLTALAASRDIETAVVISKSDLDGACAAELADIYKKAGMEAFAVSIFSEESLSDFRAFFQKGKLYAFAGNTGVGKSSLLNRLDPGLRLPTGEISEKLGRGKHTTRQVEIFRFLSSYVADTPGFSSFELEKNGVILKEDLADCFIEFREHISGCKFSGCSHTNDRGCKVREAVEQGQIPESRHKSYVTMYEEVKDVREWEIK